MQKYFHGNEPMFKDEAAISVILFEVLVINIMIEKVDYILRFFLIRPSFLCLNFCIEWLLLNVLFLWFH